jgi:hypothetical protein
MPKGKVVVKESKRKSILKMAKKDDLSGMFNKLLGTEAADPKIVLPKYKDCVSSLILLANYMCKFSTDKNILDSFPDEKNNLLELHEFSNDIINVVGSNKISSADTPIITDDKINSNDLAKKYLDLKKTDTVKIIFIMHSQLKRYEKYIKDDTALSDKFITNAVGYEIYPFKKISGLNLYKIWAKNPPDTAKTYILKFLHHIYKQSFKICNIILSPDVDIREFGKIIIKYITKLKTVIPNCSEAFKRIERAVDLLEDNFDGYYRDLIKTEDPLNMFSSFVEDVATEQTKQRKPNLVLLSQFRKIINHLRDATRKDMDDPQLKSMFDLLNGHMNTLERHTATDDSD